MSKQKISLLDPQTVNQIAAGEVVENGASVIKELVENSLDAGAHTIVVETQGSGRGLIRISDDGSGMEEEELPLALARHATSKLFSFEGLRLLTTLGFRGEALPSIAAVSKLSLHSSTEDGRGSLLEVEGGEVVSCRPLPRRRGTTIEVRALFYNVPVRKAFQKSLAADSVEIHKLLTQFALCYPQVAWRWVAEGREQFSFSATLPLKARIASLLGEQTARAFLPLAFEKGGRALTGFCSDLSLHRPQRTGQTLFINQRIVSPSIISDYVSEGYATRLSTNRYPLFVLHLTLPPDALDVNVHPQKREVRLREEEEVRAFVCEAVRQALTPPLPVVPAAPLPLRSEEEWSPIPPPAPYQTAPPEQPTLFALPRRVVATVGRYLLLAEEEGVRVVDRVAARCRLLYDALSRKDYKEHELQPLLVPIQLEVTAAEEALVAEHLSAWEERGFRIRLFGPRTFLIEAIPPLFSQGEVIQLFHAFLEKGTFPQEKMLASLLRKTVQCPSERGGEALVEALFRSEESTYTPEGKVIHYLLTERELQQISFGKKEEQ